MRWSSSGTSRIDVRPPSLGSSAAEAGRRCSWVLPRSHERYACAAHLLITRALKLAPASTLAPLHYTLLLWAVVFGLVFFGDVPGPRILVGAAIVVVAGLFIFHRQKVVDTVPPENVPKGVN